MPIVKGPIALSSGYRNACEIKTRSLGAFLHELLQGTFDTGADELSRDVHEAHAQYNNRGGDYEHLGIPLIATDAALDRWGIMLLDCPDVQSDTLCSRTRTGKCAIAIREQGGADLFRIHLW